MMQRLIPATLLVLMPSLAFGFTPIPDYQTKGVMIYDADCDGGKTRLTYFRDGKTLDWILAKGVVPSGDTFYMLFFPGKGQPLFFVKKAGDDQAKNLPHQEFDKLFEKTASNAYNEAHGIPSDCKTRAASDK